MRRFQFRLDSALRWRQSRTLQRELELQVLVQARFQLTRDRDLLIREREDAIAEVRTATSLTGADLLQLRHFIDVSVAREVRLELRIREAEERCLKARQLFQEARRDEKILDSLKAKALEEWRVASLRDAEIVAGETFLSNWVRRQPQ